MITLSAQRTARGAVNKYYLLLTAIAGLSVGLIAAHSLWCIIIIRQSPAATLREPRPKRDKTEKKSKRIFTAGLPSVAGIRRA